MESAHPRRAARISHTPRITVLFAAFLGYNPIEQLAGKPVLAALHPHARAILTGRSFFPHLISAPFRSGLHEAFAFAIVACLIAAAASLLRGGIYHHEEADASTTCALISRPSSRPRRRQLTRSRK